MTIAIIWAVAIGIYIAFRLFYDNWRGPLKPAEIAHYKAALDNTPYLDPTEKQNVIDFMKQDDGKEFFMFNICRFQSGKVTNPDTGETMSGSEMVNQYSRPFIGTLLGRAGHPYLMLRKIAGYVDSWEEDGSFPEDPEWHFVNAMRYRSRRDLMEMVVKTADAKTHQFKRIGMAQTFNFPTRPMMRTHLGPRSGLLLILALLASLATIAVS